MIHEIKIKSNSEMYALYNEHKRAIFVEYAEDKYQLWDTVILKNDLPKWSDLPLFRKISFIEYAGMNSILLHLK